jgi:hypothetical protein
MDVPIVCLIWHFFTVSKVLISTGYPYKSAKMTEVIDLEDNNVTCKDLEDFSWRYQGAVGANLASMPIICGGHFSNGSDHSSEKCFVYIPKFGLGWRYFASMIDRRGDAAGIVYENGFHIFGGFDRSTSTILQSSEIVKEDGTPTEGPQLPTPMHLHAIGSINSSVSIINGGIPTANTYTDKTWYFNHATWEFQPGPNLLKPRIFHSSATITDQESKEKIVVVAGGQTYSGQYMNTPEFLINGEWEAGK